MTSSGFAPDPPPALPHGFAELADGYDVVLCDLWGVIHDGRSALQPAVDAMVRFRAKGGTVVAITNAPRPRASVAAQLAGLGVAAEAFDTIVTSGDVTIAAIASLGPTPIYHVGPERDLTLFHAAEETAGLRPMLAPFDTAEAVVVTGLFDDASETPDDYREMLAAMRARRLPMICANPDIVVHVGDHLIYCGGALAEAYAVLGGETILAGKPHAPIYDAALRHAAEHRGRPFERNRVLAIGDGLKTDVAGAAAQNLDMLFITSGIHRDDLHPEGETEFDRLAYAERLAGVKHPLRAAMPRLAW